MASVKTVAITDDLDGSDGASPVRFGVDGQEYLIDLSPPNAAALREALAPWIAAARKSRS